MPLIERSPPPAPLAGLRGSARMAPAGGRAWQVNPGACVQATPGPAGPDARTGGWPVQQPLPVLPPGRARQRRLRPPAGRWATGPLGRLGTARAGFRAPGTTPAAEYADSPGRG